MLKLSKLAALASLYLKFEYPVQREPLERNQLVERNKVGYNVIALYICESQTIYSLYHTVVPKKPVIRIPVEGSRKRGEGYNIIAPYMCESQATYSLYYTQPCPSRRIPLMSGTLFFLLLERAG
jgi:hypothetical protein